MSYDYNTQKQELLTEEGVNTLLAVRDNCNALIEQAGAVMSSHAMHGISGDSWTQLAALDYLVERGELREITENAMGQYRVFVQPGNGG